MTDHATLTVYALIVLAALVFLLVLLAPLIVHLRWEDRQRRRGGRYIP